MRRICEVKNLNVWNNQQIGLQISIVYWAKWKSQIGPYLSMAVIVVVFILHLPFYNPSSSPIWIRVTASAVLTKEWVSDTNLNHLVFASTQISPFRHHLRFAGYRWFSSCILQYKICCKPWFIQSMKFVVWNYEFLTWLKQNFKEIHSIESMHTNYSIKCLCESWKFLSLNLFTFLDFFLRW